MREGRVFCKHCRRTSVTNSVNLHTWRPGGSVQSDTIFALKPPNLSFPVVLSRLDHCNGLLAGSPRVLLEKIQRVINCSARLIFKVPLSAHIAALLYDRHWLPISGRIQYKIALICFHIVSGAARLYLSELLHLYSPSRSLRSASDTRIFRVPRMGRKRWGRDPFNTLDL